MNFSQSFQGDDVAGLDITTLEELQNLHVEAITKICHAKVTYPYINIYILLHFLNYCIQVAIVQLQSVESGVFI